MITALAGAITTDEVASAIFDMSALELGAGSTGLWLLNDGETHLSLAGHIGFADSVSESFGRISLDADLPGAVVVRTGEPLTYRSVAERDQRWPALTGVASAVAATAIMPLLARGRTIGCLAIGFAEERDFGDGELQFFGALAEHCALALDRARLYDDEREARETLEFLAEATRIIVSAARPADVLGQLVQLAVPRLAPWCAVYVRSGDVLGRVAMEATDPVVAERLSPDAAALDQVDLPAVRAFTTQKAQPFEGGISVPMVARGEILGVMTLGFGEPSDRPGPQRLYAVTELAARGAVALDNAHRLQEEHDRAELLTQALLPARMPDIPGFRYAARYVPSSGAVCGDWYDALALGDGLFLLGVGDAAGHGLIAASVMAELRNAARGLAAAGRSPGQLMGDLSALAGDVDPERFATVTYAQLDTARSSLRWSLAGHPPPLLVDADGARYLELASGPPLGLFTGRYPEVETTLAAGDLVVLFTDGVVERRGEALDVGLERLRQVVLVGGTRTVDDLADQIVRELCQQHEDDCSIFVLRREGAQG
jgi:GAF domain-containing protein